MPEGDSVWRATARLHRAFAGQQMVGVDLRTPRHATTGGLLAGRATIEVVPRGKHLLHRFEGGFTLHSHLRMDGRWLIGPESARRRPVARRHTVRAVLWSAGRAAVGDQLGMLDVLRTADEHRVVGHLGPDLLDPEFDRDRAVANLLADRRTIAEALLDQRNLAGLGTIFTAEPLHRVGLRPWEVAAELGADTVEHLVEVARELLWTSAHDGRSMDARDADYRPGGAPTIRRRPGEAGWIQDGVGLPCRRCGAPLRSGRVGAGPQQRMLTYCAPCQGGLAPGDPGGPAIRRRT